MTRFLTLEDLDAAAHAALGEAPRFRDYGIWESAVARHGGVVLGKDVYPGLADKAGALLHSIAGMHPLVDGNKRVGWVVVRLFYGLNGRRLRYAEDEAFEFVMAIAAGDLSDVVDIAKRLEDWRE